MTPAETPTECEARKENTTGFRQAVWDLLDEDADLNRCRICGHEYFSYDNWDDIDPHAVEYAEHLNHHTRVIQEKDARIRELVGALGKVIHLAEDQHERVRLFQQQIGEDLLPHNPQCAVEPGLAEARAALARSEGEK